MYDDYLDKLIMTCENNIILENYNTQNIDTLINKCVSIIKKSKMDSEIKKNIKYDTKSIEDNYKTIFSIDFLNIASIKKILDSDASNQEINNFMNEKTKNLFIAIDKCKIECDKYNKSSNSNNYIDIEGDKWDDLSVALVTE